MRHHVTVAAVQMACTDDRAANLDKAETLIREAAGLDSDIVLLPELFETPYFCKAADPDQFRLARRAPKNPMLARLRQLARELRVVLPVTFFEQAGNEYFCTLAVIDADGRGLGFYRMAHVPDSPGYREKFYFRPGDGGFRIWNTAAGRVGVALGGDQWYPEAARLLVLMGAEILLVPCAEGSDPRNPLIDNRDHWQRVLQGHAAANLVPIVAANRVGTEESDGVSITFHGSSFIADPYGAKVAETGRAEEYVLTHRFDPESIRAVRDEWALLRDRRPDLYGELARGPAAPGAG